VESEESKEFMELKSSWSLTSLNERRSGVNDDHGF
jgi:hypothetical protein